MINKSIMGHSWNLIFLNIEKLDTLCLTQKTYMLKHMSLTLERLYHATCDLTPSVSVNVQQFIGSSSKKIKIFLNLVDMLL